MNGVVYGSDVRTQVGKTRVAKETTIAVFVESDVNWGATAIKYTHARVAGITLTKTGLMLNLI